MTALSVASVNTTATAFSHKLLGYKRKEEKKAMASSFNLGKAEVKQRFPTDRR